MNRHMPWHIGVAIPARNEEKLLPRCIRSVQKAVAALGDRATADIVVVVDSSTDRSLDLAGQMLRSSGQVVSIDAGAVGVARSAAVSCLLQRHRGPLSRLWIANTDADCIVPGNWLLDQLDLADTGLEAMAGTISVESFEEHGPEVQARFNSSYHKRPDGSHAHVHGANLGVRADAYIRAGGWHPLHTAEDHDLWNRLAGTGRAAALLLSLRFRPAEEGWAGRLTDLPLHWPLTMRRRRDTGSALSADVFAQRIGPSISGIRKNLDQASKVGAVSTYRSAAGSSGGSSCGCTRNSHEAKREPRAGLYGVWAADTPGYGVQLESTARGMRVTGSKMFCSGAGIIDRALLSVSDCLVDVNLRECPECLVIDQRAWKTSAFAETNTATVCFSNAPVEEIIGERSWYLDRPGFWAQRLWSRGLVGLAARWGFSIMHWDSCATMRTRWRIWVQCRRMSGP